MSQHAKPWLVAFALTGALAITSCSGAGEGDSNAVDQDLVVSLGALPSNGDPDVDSSLITSAPYRAIYEALVVLEEGEILPQLATSWEPTSDTTWELTLREGVTFSDGSDFDAEVAAWNLNRTVDPETQTTRPMAGVVSASALSPTVLEITTAAADAGLMNRLLNQFMKSKEAFETLGADGFATAPVGTGPFVVREWQRDEQIVLERNDDYWDGSAALDTLTFKMIPDASTRVAELQTGASHVVYEIPPEQATALPNDEIDVVNVPLSQTLVLFLRNNQDSPLNDTRVRQAIAHGLDVNAIAEATLGEFARIPVSGGIATPESFGFDPDLEAFPYDPDLARKLLAEAGYADGFSVVFESSQGRYAKDREASQIVASQLGEIGIDASVSFLESGLYLEKLFSASMAPLYIMGTNSAPTYDNGASLCSMFFPPIQFSDPPASLCEDAAKVPTIFDVDERRQEILRLDRQRHDEAFMIQLFQLPGIYGISTGVSGLTLNPDYAFADYLTVAITG